ncbi:protein SON isoform X2 [Colossoma macropomum]|uniref:protein SON isoform X2 n=1 Tax=Colossoma macropomum TaxID=42526 RepID=UPI0018650B5A|nr:protein SON isoform X2 [Colossoma macropomum]
MATNIEQIFRDFVMNKIKEIEDESQDKSRTGQVDSNDRESLSDWGTGINKEAPPVETISKLSVTNPSCQDNSAKDEFNTKHKKTKKHKKHKSKKKRKKRKEEKESSSETESDGETQGSVKKKKRKKKKKQKKGDKVKRSGSRSESSSVSESESEYESKPFSETTKSSTGKMLSKSELCDGGNFKISQELPDIVPKLDTTTDKNKKIEGGNERSSSRSSTSRQERSLRARCSPSRSSKRKSRHRSRSQSLRRSQRSKSKSRSRKSPKRKSPQQRHRSRSRSRSQRCSRQSRSHSAKKSRHSRSRSMSRRSRSRSTLILKKNRRSRSKSRSVSHHRSRHSRSRSRLRAGHSTSRSRSKSKSFPKDNQIKTEIQKNDMVPELKNEVSSAIEAGTKNIDKDGNQTLAVNTGSTVKDGTISDGQVKGSWRPVPFLDNSSSTIISGSSETKPSVECITPELPLDMKDISEDTSDRSKDLGDVLRTVKKEEITNVQLKDTQVVKHSKSRSKSTSPTPQRHSKSVSRKRSRSRSPRKRRRSRSSSKNSKKTSKSSPSRRKRSKSRTRNRHSESRSPKRKKSKSHSPDRRKRSRTPDRSRRSRSRHRSCSRSRRSRSGSRRRRGGFRSRMFSQRDRWKREPSHSPVLILRKKRSTSRTRRSSSKTPPRLTELDKDQLLEIAKANAAAMCAKAGMPVPESLRPKAILQLPLPTPNPTPLSLPLPLPVNLPMGVQGMSNMTMNAAMASMTAATMTAALSSMGALAAMPQLAPLPTITNKPPPSATPNLASIEEAKRKVTKQANSYTIKELTEKCKKIAESKEEMAIAKPHVSDDEEDEKPFGGLALKENKGITFSLSNPSVKPAVRSEAAFAKEFPVSSGSQHRKKEGDGAYGEWVPVDKKNDKAGSSSASAGAEDQNKDNDSVFPDAPSQPVDITLAVSERAVAQKRLAENPFDINAMCMLNRAQEQVDAWAQSNTIPGLFTGSTGAQVLSSEELSNSGPQAWIKKQVHCRRGIRLQGLTIAYLESLL